MAFTSTLHNLRIGLSDSDRGVYETLELRIARHPSEGLPFMLTRVLAYCLFYEPEIAFSRGLAAPDEPALWVRSLDGRVLLWIDVGRPSADRLHKAGKAAERVVVCTFQDPRVLQRAVAGERIHRAAEIELVTFPTNVLDALEAQIAKRMDWDVVVTGGQLYVTTGGITSEGELVREPLIKEG